jgi:4-hydroxybenzoate polyprenyltransferase
MMQPILLLLLLPAGWLRKCGEFLETIKVSHSVFALPFAVSAAFLAAEGAPSWSTLGKVVLAVVLARTAAMSFNRTVDARIDALNPRTHSRAVPAGRLSPRFMAGATLVSSSGFIVVCSFINNLALLLSPLVLAVLLGYSLTKRFTSLSHLALGAALGLSPLGAWVAVREEVAILPLLLGLAVLTWTAGFDIIYACQDRDFDRSHRLHSAPARLGLRKALLLSRALHLLTLVLLVLVGFEAQLGVPYAAGVGAVATLLVYEHSIVSPTDLSRVNVAFFTLNGLVSLVFMGGVVVQTMI